jgi:hypothetical protein
MLWEPTTEILKLQYIFFPVWFKVLTKFFELSKLLYLIKCKRVYGWPLWKRVEGWLWLLLGTVTWFFCKWCTWNHDCSLFFIFSENLIHRNCASRGSPLYTSVRWKLTAKCFPLVFYFTWYEMGRICGMCGRELTSIQGFSGGICKKETICNT